MDARDVRVEPAAVALTVVIVVVSWHTTTRLGGVTAGVVGAVLVALAAVVGAPWATERLRHAPSWLLPALVTAGVVALTIAYVAGAPAAYGDVLGVGSDRSNALDVALARLVEVRYPYSATTYLGNPITPLPGSFVLAAPFWWLTGSSAAQNLAWLLLLLPVLCGGARLRPGPAVLWALAVFGTAETWRELLIGDDLVAVAVPALAAAVGVLRASQARSTGVLAVAAVALGVTTCTRPHMALVLVVVVAAVAVRAGARRAALVGGGGALTWAVLIAPFLLDGPHRFSPLHVTAKVTGERGVTPGIVVVALAALALLVVALRAVRPASPEIVGWFCAAVLFAPSLLSVARALVTHGEPVDLTLGTAAVPFAVWAMAVGDDDVRDPEPSPARLVAG